MSTYVSLSNITFSYPSASFSIFESLSLSFNEGWTSIVGSNGSGKSTLASLIEGSLSPDSGTITKRGNVVLCSQIFPGIKDEDYASLYDYSSHAYELKRSLGLTDEMFLRFETLSGGEKKRLQAYLALSSSPDILILDEPTNHLDIKSKDYLLSALKSFKGCGIIISHDRDFLSSLSERTIIMTNYDGSTPTFFEDIPLPVAQALSLSQEKKEALRRDRNALGKEIKRMGSSERNLKAKSENLSSRLSKAGLNKKDHDGKGKIDAARLTGKDRSLEDQRHALLSRLDNKEKELSRIDSPKMRKEGISNIESSALISSFVIEETTLKVGKLTIKVPHIEIKRGDKIAITGDNGSGKTLFIRYAVNEYLKKSDKLLYLKQEYSEDDRARLSLILNKMDDKEKGDLLSLMFRLGSNSTSFSEGAINLSSGEMRKLDFLLSINRGYPLYIMDEPTNHLDITSLLVMEEILKESKASLIIVSHDKSLLREVCNREFHFEREGNTTEIKEMMHNM